MKLLLQIAHLFDRTLRAVGACGIFALEFIGDLFEKYKLARRALLLWAMIMITHTVHMFWENLSSFTQPQSVVLAIIGLLSIVLGFYQWSRGRDE